MLLVLKTRNYNFSIQREINPSIFQNESKKNPRQFGMEKILKYRYIEKEDSNSCGKKFGFKLKTYRYQRFNMLIRKGKAMAKSFRKPKQYLKKKRVC